MLHSDFQPQLFPAVGIEHATVRGSKLKSNITVDIVRREILLINYKVGKLKNILCSLVGQFILRKYIAITNSALTLLTSI